MNDRFKDFLSESTPPDWERVWASMPVRTLSEPAALKLPIDQNAGKALSGTISEAPIQYLDYLYLPSDECLLCSESTASSDRIPACLSIQFEHLKGKIGLCSWVHRSCFEKLEISDEKAPIPW